MEIFGIVFSCRFEGDEIQKKMYTTIDKARIELNRLAKKHNDLVSEGSTLYEDENDPNCWKSKPKRFPPLQEPCSTYHLYIDTFELEE